MRLKGTGAVWRRCLGWWNAARSVRGPRVNSDRVRSIPEIRASLCLRRRLSTASTPSLSDPSRRRRKSRRAARDTAIRRTSSCSPCLSWKVSLAPFRDLVQSADYADHLGGGPFMLALDSVSMQFATASSPLWRQWWRMAHLQGRFVTRSPDQKLHSAPGDDDIQTHRVNRINAWCFLVLSIL